MIEIISFGFGHAPAPSAHLTADLRHHYRDPHVSPELRHLTARDARVRAAVAATPGITALAAAVDAYTAGPGGGPVTVALGCTGGRHRAPTTAEMLATVLRGRGHTATVAHRDLALPVLTR